MIDSMAGIPMTVAATMDSMAGLPVPVALDRMAGLSVEVAMPVSVPRCLSCEGSVSILP